MGSQMRSVGTDMDTGTTIETLNPVEFIDEWLEANSFTVDSRMIDFALDLRILLVEGADAEGEREPATAGV